VLDPTPEEGSLGAIKTGRECLPHHDTDMPFMKNITDTTCMFPQKIRNGDTCLLLVPSSLEEGAM
jgi:hypothetical protein